MIGASSSRRSRPRSSALAASVSLLVAFGCLADVARAASPSAQDLDAARRRPLFAPTRRPPPSPAAEPVEPVQPVAAVEPTLNVEVRGIIFGDNHRVAIIKQPSSPQTVEVAVGSDIDGWVVDAIRPRGIVLRRESRTITLSMPEPGH